jgi:hypothetical protein
LEDQPVESTLYSLNEAAPAPPQRRTEERYLSLLRVGTLLIGERRELCLIRNISAGGMMIRAYTEIELGTPVTIELKEGEPVSGKALWAKDGLVGVHFDEPIDVVELLAPAADGPRPRMPRIEVSCTAFVREGAHVRRTKTLNISQGGIGVESPAELTIDGEVIVSLLGLSPIPGVVRWHDGNSYGISFNRVMALSDLVAWIQAQQEQERRRAAAG